MIILDSNVWIGFFNQLDSLHPKAVKEMAILETRNIVVPEYVFLEVVTVLRLRAGYDIAQKFMEHVRSCDNLELLFSNQWLFYQSVEIFGQYQKIAFTNALLVVLSKEYKIVTFDKELIKAIKLYDD